VIDLNEMLVFARVVGRGSFSAAARELGVPPSTLSRKIGALEQRLGTPLLERTTRRLRLTEAGALYYERCRQIAELAGEADAAVEGLTQSPRGLLRVAAPPAWSQAFLAEPVAEFVARHPEVRVEIVMSSELAADGFDLAIRIAPSIDDTSLMVRRLGASTPVPCASPEYVAAHGTPDSLDDLFQHAIIGLGRARAQFAWRFLDEDGQAIPLPLQPRVQVNSAWMARELCRAGVGIALLPSFLAGPDLDAGTLVRVLPEVASRPLDVYVVFPPSAGSTAKVRAFLYMLYEHFAANPPWV
jgi:LysR family transcriptional regulator for bpeEF and oprC